MKNRILKIAVTVSMLLVPIANINSTNIKAKGNINKELLKINKPKYNYININEARMKHLEKLKKKKEEKERRAALAAKEEKEKYKNMYIPNHSSFKSYMPYTAITSKNSPQYKLQRKACSDKNGLRKYGKYYLVAMGQYYGKVGDRFKVTLSSGQVFYAMIGDSKQFKHTGEGSGMIGADNKDMFEFIVDYSCLNKEIRKMGNVDVVLKGKVVKLQKEK